jgi:hypothetical protein
MKTILCFFLIVMLLLPGCARFHHVKHNKSSYTQVNRKIAGEEALIFLASGQEIEAEIIRVAIDSTSWVEKHSQRKQVVPTSEVKAIKKPIGKKWSYFTPFVVSGIVLGAIIAGVVMPENAQLPGGDDLAPAYAIGGVLIGAIGGCLIGIAAGGPPGTSHKYVLNAPTDSTSQDTDERQER